MWVETCWSCAQLHKTFLDNTTWMISVLSLRPEPKFIKLLKVWMWEIKVISKANYQMYYNLKITLIFKGPFQAWIKALKLLSHKVFAQKSQFYWLKIPQITKTFWIFKYLLLHCYAHCSHCLSAGSYNPEYRSSLIIRLNKSSGSTVSLQKHL